MLFIPSRDRPPGSYRRLKETREKKRGGKRGGRGKKKRSVSRPMPLSFKSPGEHRPLVLTEFMPNMTGKKKREKKEKREEGGRRTASSSTSLFYLPKRGLLSSLPARSAIDWTKERKKGRKKKKKGEKTAYDTSIYPLTRRGCLSYTSVRCRSGGKGGRKEKSHSETVVPVSFSELTSRLAFVQKEKEKEKRGGKEEKESRRLAAQLHSSPSNLFPHNAWRWKGKKGGETGWLDQVVGLPLKPGMNRFAPASYRLRYQPKRRRKGKKGEKPSIRSFIKPRIPFHLRPFQGGRKGRERGEKRMLLPAALLPFCTNRRKEKGEDPVGFFFYNYWVDHLLGEEGGKKIVLKTTF